MDPMSLMYMLFFLMIMLINYAPLMWKAFLGMIAKAYLIHYKKYVKREVVMLYHGNAGFLVTPMIDTNTYNKVRTILESLKGTPVDLILHTPGGEIFATMLLSKLIKSYPDLRVVVPRYAMSGGTVLALSTPKLVMGKHAVLGPVDPQIGGLFSGSFNARIWKEISKVKKGKIKDENIGLGFVANQYHKTISEYIANLLQRRLNGKKLKEFVGLLVAGEIEHGYQFDAEFLSKYIKVDTLDERASRYLYKVIDCGPGSEILTTAVVR